MLACNEPDESDGGNEAMVKREWYWLYLAIFWVCFCVFFVAITINLFMLTNQLAALGIVYLVS
jgi:hypothetical protein